MARWTNRPSWWNDPITQRQERAIATITQWLGHQFTGRVKGDAMGFIGEYYELAKEVRDNADVNGVTNRSMASFILEAEGPWG
jgi:hypothetical protein